jgi:coenzyme F420-0:L-glutamate ligase/coenzyme F420-1:gamma-L-glutamate ligase
VTGRVQPLTVIPVHGVPEVRPDDLLAPLIADAAAAQDTPLLDRDCIVVTQKIVSKAEGRLVEVDPDDREARRVIVEGESVRILRRRGDLIISETRHGFVCANAGVDLSNVAAGTAALLPVDSDRSAKHVRDALRARRGVEVAVIVSDTFGRPWRLGLTDVAIGVCGIAAVLDLRGEPDALGRELQVTEVAIADEIACAAELVMGKSAGVPAAIVRGLDPTWLGDGSARDLVRAPSEDLFR